MANGKQQRVRALLENDMDIRELAIRAGFAMLETGNESVLVSDPGSDAIVRFAALVQAAEREACGQDKQDAIVGLRSELERVQRSKGLRFAGWFSELKSGMSYRLWEQGGHEPEAGDRALYEA